MSVYRMNRDQLFKFIELYRDSECLWNVKKLGYKDREARDQAYKHIVNEMEITGFGPKEVAQKIKNLRTTYKQELRKIKKSETSGSSPDDIYKPKVPWFDFVDTFLRNIIRVQPTLSNLVTEKSDNTLTQIEDGNVKPGRSTQQEQQSEGEGNQKRQSSSSSVEPISKQHRRIRKEPCALLYITEALDRLENIKAASKQTEFDVWARSLAIQLNEMELRRALNLQLQIQLLVSNERLAYENNKAGNQPFTAGGYYTQHPTPQATQFMPPLCSTSYVPSNWQHHAHMQHCQINVAGNPEDVRGGKDVRPPSTPREISPTATEDTVDSIVSSIYSLNEPT